jgi:ligand-binding sensor domain-containing protein/serine phosphatase RsbU (regulator of sigma subunit)
VSKILPIKILVLLLAVFSPAAAQKYNFRHFAPPAISDPVVYSVNQDAHGFIWAGTGKGLYRYDGYVFREVSFPDSAELRFANVLFRGTDGTMWVGGSDGTLHFSDGNLLVKVTGIESQRINDITEGPEGDIYALTQNNGIFIVSGSGIERRVSHLAPPDRMLLFSMDFTADGMILAGTGDDLQLLSVADTGLISVATVEGIEYTRVNAIISDSDGGFYAGTEDNGIYTVSRTADGYVARPLSEDKALAFLRIQSLYLDSEGNLWASTYGAGVVKLYVDKEGNGITGHRRYNQETGLAGNDARSVFQDSEGNTWIALYGAGLNMLVSEAFTYYRPGNTHDENSIVYIGSNGKELVLGAPSGYHLFDLFTGTSSRFEPVTRSTGGVPATTYLAESDGTIWIGTGGAGLFIKRPGEMVRPFFSTANAGENYIASVISHENDLWLSTRNGIMVVNRKTGSLIKKFNTLSQLPHNNINQVFIDRSGVAYVATEAGNIYTADVDRGVSIGSSEIAGMIRRNVIQAFTQAPDGSLWIATLGNGVFHTDGKMVTSLGTQDGLLSNFCYSILSDSESLLWIGHHKGFSRFDPSTGAMSVFSTTFAGEGDCNLNAIYEAPDGTVFIGTTTGLIVYNRQKDLKGSVPPYNNIISVTINDIVYPWQKQIMVPYDRHLVKIDYVGISHSNPDQVRYRTRLGNYDTDWSEPGSSRQITYRLTDGDFTFSLETWNASGASTVTEEMVRIIVRKPFWRRWWFILSSISLVTGLVVIIIRIREANQRRMREHLEHELQERTKEVVRQKEEIEQQNFEITDSINYARRIQASILPDVSKLRESFRDAFIIFLPRDIVSGDFYWFEKLSEDKFILACADSTGHGVPGAFMSMIGSTLLQDIVTRRNIVKPSEILLMLDQQIFSTLNRNLDVGVSNDGMDMVICEFNLKNRHVRFASAMRPVILVLNGEPNYIKGNRSSVGGMAFTEKYFIDQEYYLSEGDALYLFSDGFPDQFGGKDGKKMKVARFKKLIESVIGLPMEEQKEYISNFFFEWKGSHEQVDDILFMGIKF